MLLWTFTETKKGVCGQKYLSGSGRSALSGNIVHEIIKDKYGNFWIGTEDGGLNKIDSKSGLIQHFIADGKPGSITLNNIHGLASRDAWNCGKDTGTGIGLNRFPDHWLNYNKVCVPGLYEEDRNLFLLSCPILQDQSLDIKSLDDEVQSRSYSTSGYEDSYEDTDKPVILLVEDNKEILAYLNKELKLVLTDIMMPVMDGLALCKRIKSDILYSHIPVIFLTAKNALDAKIEGIKTGADAYIEKPFSMEYLLVQIRNTLKNRMIIRAYFTNSPSSKLTEINVSPRDKDFISQLSTVIYDNISDIDLNVEDWLKLMNMSRPTLYRKIKGLSDLTPNELINISRLKRAQSCFCKKNIISVR
ncbi:hypothetical protein FQR65_LT16020 [Abscondita terminalis]|nr:hypothetical protein FQR65_LT16020 [Abscondita terminalis]